MPNGDGTSDDSGDSNPVAATLAELASPGAARLSEAEYAERASRLKGHLAAAFEPLVEQNRSIREAMREEVASVEKSIEANRALTESLSDPSAPAKVAEIPENKIAVAGRVRTEGEDAAPVAGASVVIQVEGNDKKLDATTDIHGRFVVYPPKEWRQQVYQAHVEVDGETLESEITDVAARDGAEGVFDVEISVHTDEPEKFEKVASAYREVAIDKRKDELERLGSAAKSLQGSQAIVDLQRDVLRRLVGDLGDD